MSRLNFQLEASASGSRARAGHFTTLHARVETPTFMPVGTQASVRSQRLDDILASGAQVVLGNTFHLMIRPGPEFFEAVGGLHRLMGWPRSILTDSGGYQVFCRPDARIVGDEGAEFQNYVTGKRVLLTPERSIAVQKSLGSDIMMVLDECVPSTVDFARARDAMERTHRWARRSLVARGESSQSLFGIVQGACHPELRRESARVLCDMEFDGMAVGGLAVGESAREREDMTELSTELLPADRPRYLMGVGTPLDLLEAVHRGIDMFDCVLPASIAQQGVAYSWSGKVTLHRVKYFRDESPIDPECDCLTCKRYSRSYLHHLCRINDWLAWQLIGFHNLYFYQRLMARMRASILNDTFAALYAQLKPNLGCGDGIGEASKPRPKRDPAAERIQGRFEIVEVEGRAALRDREHGEVMHSKNDPWIEANALYVQQSGFAEYVLANPGQTTTVWDVGLGAATNAMAVIRCWEELRDAGRNPGPLHIVSFESDLDALRLALRHVRSFAHLKHAGPHMIAEKGAWESKCRGVTWTLLEGDFLERVADAPPADIVFFDPFSPNVDERMWSTECFTRVAQRCGDRRVGLYTYSRSTAIRTAMLLAGFRVARGASSGPKPETTVAFLGEAPPSGHPVRLLEPDWLKTWTASTRRIPFGMEAKDPEEIFVALKKHAQFAGEPQTGRELSTIPV